MTEDEEIELARGIPERARQLGFKGEFNRDEKADLMAWLLETLVSDPTNGVVLKLAADFVAVHGWLCPACLGAGKYRCHCCNDE